MIEEIGDLETYAVRHPVLRNGKPIESCHFEGDDWPTTKHFGYFENGDLLGIASVFEARNDDFDPSKQLQLRGMAVVQNQQKKGIGEQLVRHSERYALQNNYLLIWFNARESAVGFYQKLGYQTEAGPFEIAGVGIHYKMFKKLA
jgi:GNAT superfamily N-acetyltransferase